MAYSHRASQQFYGSQQQQQQGRGRKKEDDSDALMRLVWQNIATSAVTALTKVSARQGNCWLHKRHRGPFYRR